MQDPLNTDQSNFRFWNQDIIRTSFQMQQLTEGGTPQFFLSPFGRRPWDPAWPGWWATHTSGWGWGRCTRPWSRYPSAACEGSPRQTSLLAPLCFHQSLAPKSTKETNYASRLIKSDPVIVQMTGLWGPSDKMNWYLRNKICIFLEHSYLEFG